LAPPAPPLGSRGRRALPPPPPAAPAVLGLRLRGPNAHVETSEEARQRLLGLGPNQIAYDRDDALLARHTGAPCREWSRLARRAGRGQGRVLLEMNGFDGHEVRVAQLAVYRNYPVECFREAAAPAEGVGVNGSIQLHPAGLRIELLAHLVLQ